MSETNIPDVFFTDFHPAPGKNILEKIKKLISKLKLKSRIQRNFIVGIKTHFGEYGNTAYIRPIFFQPIISSLTKYGAKVFLTDTNTLYAGMRSNSIDHIKNAIKNGFSYSSLGVPIIIADGLRSKNERKIKVDLKHFKHIYLAEDILSSDFMVVVSHFKGHEMAGFGGAIKNIGMGCATRHGKLDMHSNISPVVNKKICVGCGRCIEHCPADAIKMEDKKANVSQELCIGCGDCIIICPEKAIRINWNETIPIFQEKLIEYVYGFHNLMRDKVVYINFINNVSPSCDCFHINDIPIVNDIGICASFDPIAIDKASLDLVNSTPGIPDSQVGDAEASSEKFKIVHPKVDYNEQFKYAAELNIGSTKYNLVKL